MQEGQQEGWYPDPSQPGQERYWLGGQWSSDLLRPAGGAAPAPPVRAPAGTSTFDPGRTRAPRGPHSMRGSGRHGCLPLLLVFAVVIGAIVIAVTVVAGHSPKKGAAGGNARLASDIQTVNSGVSGVRTELGIATKSNASSADVDQLSHLAQVEEGTLTNLKSRVAAEVPNNTAGRDLTNAATRLRNSMGTLVAYTGSPTPPRLARFATQYDTGVADWNHAVGEIYSSPTSSPPPTIPTGW